MKTFIRKHARTAVFEAAYWMLYVPLAAWVLMLLWGALGVAVSYAVAVAIVALVSVPVYAIGALARLLIPGGRFTGGKR